MNLQFDEEARSDLVEIYRFIGRQGSARKRRFADEFRHCLGQIKAMPEEWPRVAGPIRVRAMRRFGFGIYYRCRGSNIVVGAIVHLSRPVSVVRKRFQ